MMKKPFRNSHSRKGGYSTSSSNLISDSVDECVDATQRKERVAHSLGLMLPEEGLKNTVDTLMDRLNNKESVLCHSKEPRKYRLH